jgi:hypothetical protein
MGLCGLPAVGEAQDSKSEGKTPCKWNLHRNIQKTQYEVWIGKTAPTKLEEKQDVKGKSLHSAMEGRPDEGVV